MNTMRIVWIVAVVALLNGCASSTDVKSTSMEEKIISRGYATVKPDRAVIRTFFATDRNVTGNQDPGKMFGVGRSSITFGICDVSIPRDHRMGELESPSIWRLEFHKDQTKHVVLLKTAVSSKDKFFEDLASRVLKSEKRSALLFVHGYNVTFEDAARRTAQMAYDLAFEGAPVFDRSPFATIGNCPGAIFKRHRGAIFADFTVKYATYDITPRHAVSPCVELSTIQSCFISLFPSPGC